MDSNNAKLHKALVEKLNVKEVRSSTRKYYKEHKDRSYPINVANETRGRAIVFIMTKDRNGYQKEVQSLYSFFESFKIKTDYQYDLHSNGIYNKLLNSVEDESNEQIDYFIAVFAGHGFSKDSGQNVYLRTADNREFNIWEGCQYIFTRESSRLKNKPKVVLVQACRETLAFDGELDATASINKLGNFHDYLFGFACQPGETAKRNVYLVCASEKLIKYGYCYTVEEILQKLVLQAIVSDTGYHRQMPQYIGSMPKYLNLFPGREHELLGKPSSSSLNISKNPLQKSMPKYQNLFPGMEHELLGKPSSSSLNISKNPPQKKKESVNPRSRTIGENKRSELSIQIRKTKKNTLKNRRKALRTIYYNLRRRDNQKVLENQLSKDLDTRVTIDGVTEGSLIIHIILEEEAAFERLVYLNDTGLLTFLMQMHLVNKEYLEPFDNIDDVQIDVVLLTSEADDLPPIIEKLSTKYAVLRNDIKITCPCQSKGNLNDAKWSKDGEVIQTKHNRKFKQDNGRHQIEILRSDRNDTGCYRCEYTGIDNRKHITECVLEKPAEKAKYDFNIY